MARPTSRPRIRTASQTEIVTVSLIHGLHVYSVTVSKEQHRICR